MSFDIYQWIQTVLSYTYFLLLLSWTYSLLLGLLHIKQAMKPLPENASLMFSNKYFFNCFLNALIVLRKAKKSLSIILIKWHDIQNQKMKNILKSSDRIGWKKTTTPKWELWFLKKMRVAFSKKIMCRMLIPYILLFLEE